MNGRYVAIALAVVLAVVILWVLVRPDAGPGPDGEGGPTLAEETAPEVPEDPIDSDLLALQEEARALAPRGAAAERSPEAELFVAHAREVGDAALSARRPEVSARVGDLLLQAGEVEFAGAVLQRAVGLMKPEEAGKDHLYALARIRRAQGRPVEAASLFERAVHAPPTLPDEFVGLSEQYLAAGRMGPARAAVERGLRAHAGSPVLAVQGAKVAVLDGDPAGALATLDARLAAEPTDLAARLTRIEALLAMGSLEPARDAAAAMREEMPDDAWGYVLGAAAERALGGQGTELLARARELAGDCPCTRDERLGIAWAEQVAPGAQVAPRSRADLADQPVPAPAGEGASAQPAGAAQEAGKGTGTQPGAAE